MLAHLLANGFRGKVKLVYIDPPFDSGADYVRKVSLRGATGTAKLDGETYTLGEQVQYTDIWANDNYLQFMYERLMLLKELLAEDGSIYLHCDWHRKPSTCAAFLMRSSARTTIVSEIIREKCRSKELYKCRLREHTRYSSCSIPRAILPSGIAYLKTIPEDTIAEDFPKTDSEPEGGTRPLPSRMLLGSSLLAKLDKLGRGILRHLAITGDMSRRHLKTGHEATD